MPPPNFFFGDADDERSHDSMFDDDDDVVVVAADVAVDPVDDASSQPNPNPNQLQNNNLDSLHGRHQQQQQASPEQVIAKIEALVTDCIAQLDDLDPPTLGSRSFYHATECRTLTSVLLVASFCHALLISKRTTTTREVYYFHVTHFRSKQECDSAICELAALLGVSRQSLGLYASPKGWVCGCLDLYHKDPPGNLHLSGVDDFDGQGMVISHDLLQKYRLQSDTAKCILVIEKEGIYARLVEDRFFEVYPCILVTGKGFPDVATRQFVHALQRELRLPVYGLCDCNPFGVSLLHSYQYDQIVGRRRHGQEQQRRPATRGGTTISGITGLTDNNSRKRAAGHNKDSDNDDDSSSGDDDTRNSDDNSLDADNDNDHNQQQQTSSGRLLVLKWLGLRPSQIEDLDLPASSLQALTDLDQGRLRGLKHPSHPFQHQGNHDDERRLEELESFEYKVELEALHWKGMDFLFNWLLEQLQEQEDGGDTCI